MEQPNNIVIFPKSAPSRTVSPHSPLSRKEIDEALEENKQYHIQETVSFLIPIIFSHLNISGFTPDSENEFAVKEGAFIVESIRSHMFSHYGLKHPFQKIVDKVFVKEEGDEDGVLTIAKNIKVNLND